MDQDRFILTPQCWGLENYEIPEPRDSWYLISNGFVLLIEVGISYPFSGFNCQGVITYHSSGKPIKEESGRTFLVSTGTGKSALVLDVGRNECKIQFLGPLPENVRDVEILPEHCQERRYQGIFVADRETADEIELLQRDIEANQAALKQLMEKRLKVDKWGIRTHQKEANNL